MKKQVIVVRKDLNMRKGKLAAQAAHSAMMFLGKQFRDGTAVRIARHTTNLQDMHSFAISLSDDQVAWLEGAFAKVVVSVEDELELLRVIDHARSEGLIVNHVIDSGRTEFHGVPTLTCCAIGPHDAERIDKVTGELKLL